MDRVYKSGAVAGAPLAAENASGPYPSAGNPGGGIAATKPGPFWYHQITEEIASVITTAGLALDKNDLTQLRQSIVLLGGVPDSGVTAKKLHESAMPFGPTINGKLLHTRAGNAETVAIKNRAGNDPSAADPVWVAIRDVTAGDDSLTWLKLTAACSVTISFGSTSGALSGEAFRLWFMLFNDAGTPRLGFVRATTGTNAAGWSTMPLSAWGIASSTAEGGAGTADSAQVIYTGTAVTSKPYALLGYATWESGLGAAGTWNTAPSRRQLFGPGVPLPGSRLGTSITKTSSYATGTTIVPLDDTMPQNTEGDQFMSHVTASGSAANLMELGLQVTFSCSIASNSTGSIFQDASANPLTTVGMGSGNGTILVFPLRDTCIAGTTASVTNKFRLGNTGATATYLNGIAAARLYGGAANSHMMGTEIMS